MIFALVVAVASGGEFGFVIATTIIIIMPIIIGTLFVRFEGFIIIYHLLIFPYDVFFSVCTATTAPMLPWSQSSLRFSAWSIQSVKDNPLDLVRP